MSAGFGRITRRGVLRLACAGSVLRLAQGPASVAAAEKKVSQKDAQYQDSPKDIRMCATCTLFLPPRSCKVVEGVVSPNGWCKLFVIAD